MATPLFDLLERVINDPGTRAEFVAAPEQFLHDHGYTELDAGDVQEALFILADGSPPIESAAFSAGGHAIGELDDLDGVHGAGLAGAAAGLSTALATMTGGTELLDSDPAELDGFDDEPGDHGDHDDDATIAADHDGDDVDDVDDDADDAGGPDRGIGAALGGATGSGIGSDLADALDGRAGLDDPSDGHDDPFDHGFDDHAFDDPAVDLPDLDTPLVPSAPDAVVDPVDDTGDGWDDLI